MNPTPLELLPLPVAHCPLPNAERVYHYAKVTVVGNNDLRGSKFKLKLKFQASLKRLLFLALGTIYNANKFECGDALVPEYSQTATDDLDLAF